MQRLSVSRQTENPKSTIHLKEVDRRFPKSERLRSLESSVSRMLKPLPWKLTEEQARHEYEAQGSRFVKTLAVRAQEEAAIADQYSRLLNIEKPELSQSTAYLDDVKEDNWPSRRQEAPDLQPRQSKATRPKPVARRNADVDRLLHPWQREMKALINNSATVGSLPPLVRGASSGRTRQITATKRSKDLPGATLKAPPIIEGSAIESIGSLNDDSSIGDEDGSSIGWSPFIVPN